MREADEAVCINDGYERHPAKLEEINLLLVARRDHVPWVGQAGEWKFLRLPIDTKCAGRVGTDRQHFCTATRVFLIIVSKARQLRAAIWS